jgi:hypothetical protein
MNIEGPSLKSTANSSFSSEPEDKLTEQAISLIENLKDIASRIMLMWMNLFLITLERSEDIAEHLYEIYQ